MIRSAIGSSSLFAAAAAVALVALRPSVARAEAPSGADRTLAQSLFEQARALMESKRFAEACPKLEESQRLDPGGGTLLNLANCYESEGRTATAWASFKEALGVARKEGRSDREEFATTHIKALEPKLSRITVNVGHAAEVAGLVVTQDGVAIGRAAWGTAFPVDPGAHTVAANAPGYRAWQRGVVVSADGGTSVIDVGKLEPAGAAPAGGSTMRTVGYVVGAAGLAGIAVGTAFGVSAISSRHASDAICGATVCPPGDEQAISLNQDAKTSALASDIAFGVGAAALGVGVVLVIKGWPARAPVTVVGRPGGGAIVATW